MRSHIKCCNSRIKEYKKNQHNENEICTKNQSNTLSIDIVALCYVVDRYIRYSLSVYVNLCLLLKILAIQNQVIAFGLS